MYITQDDNAQYGLNILEAVSLQNMTSYDNMTSLVLIYPGADEVGLTLLARSTADYIQPDQPIKTFIVYRAPNGSSLIPNYEGQPMAATVLMQLQAAGIHTHTHPSALITDANSFFGWLLFDCLLVCLLPGGQQVTDIEDASLILLINNFDTPVQLEASQQVCCCSYG